MIIIEFMMGRGEYNGINAVKYQLLKSERNRKPANETKISNFLVLTPV